MFSETEIKAVLEKAVKNDIVIYDQYANHGQFTEKLIDNIRCELRSSGHLLESIIIGVDDNDVKPHADIQTIFITARIHDTIINYYFDTLKCSLPRGNSKLIICKGVCYTYGLPYYILASY